MDTGSFPGGGDKAAWKRRWPPTPISVEVKERVELYIYSPSVPSWPVLGWTSPLLYLNLSTSLLDCKVFYLLNYNRDLNTCSKNGIIPQRTVRNKKKILQAVEYLNCKFEWVQGTVLDIQDRHCNNTLLPGTSCVSCDRTKVGWLSAECSNKKVNKKNN